MIETVQLADELVSLAEQKGVYRYYWYVYASDLYDKAGFPRTAQLCREYAANKLARDL